MSGPLWDPGVQNERTALAWQRTALALLAGALLTARIAATDSPAVGLALAVVALAVAPGLLLAARYRYARCARALHATRPVGDGRLPATAAALAIGLGLTELLHLLLSQEG